MTSIRWRWEERDFGFRFKTGRGSKAQELYQALVPGHYYPVPKAQRKIEVEAFKLLEQQAVTPDSFAMAEIPWVHYEGDWDLITTEDGLCLNLAGCLDREEIHRREDEGVARAQEYVNDLVLKPEPVPVTLRMLQTLHEIFMGRIYPFAGRWRTVEMTKGEGPIKWPMPPGGLGPELASFERRVLSRTPFITRDHDALFAFVSEIINDFLAIHPFREGNGRVAFLIANLILLQNDLLAIDSYNRRADEERYFAACEAGRTRCAYGPLADLLKEWEIGAVSRRN